MGLISAIPPIEYCIDITDKWLRTQHQVCAAVTRANAGSSHKHFL